MRFANHSIRTLLLSAFATAVSCNGYLLAGPLVGVNFSTVSSHPLNWTPIASVASSPLLNLTDEDGNFTNIDLSFAGERVFAGTINPNTFPLHAPSLSSLDGNVFNNFSNASFLAIFSDLIPDHDYLIWILGARFSASAGLRQHVQIFGSGPVFEFDQIGATDLLFVNDAVGDNTRTLESYAKTINSSDGGTITIVIKGLASANGQTYTVAGLAIQPVPEPSPLALAALGAFGLLIAVRRSTACLAVK